MKRKIKTVLYLMEIYLFLGAARGLMLVIPFKKLARHLGHGDKESSQTALPLHHSKRLQSLTRTVNRLSYKTWWKSECLVRAIATAWLLRRRGYDYTIYLGVGKEEGNTMVAHAWIRSGNVWMSGSEQKGRFTIVATFSSPANNSQ